MFFGNELKTRTESLSLRFLHLLGYTGPLELLFRSLSRSAVKPSLCCPSEPGAGEGLNFLGGGGRRKTCPFTGRVLGQTNGGLAAAQEPEE